jgi:TPP-dependent pyruvate/acetoin dehydrogenase alpha subunit
MFQTVLNHGAVGESTFRDTYQKAYRYMLLSRVLDDKFASLYRAGKIQGGVFLAIAAVLTPMLNTMYTKKTTIKKKKKK